MLLQGVGACSGFEAATSEGKPNCPNSEAANQRASQSLSGVPASYAVACTDEGRGLQAQSHKIERVEIVTRLHLQASNHWLLTCLALASVFRDPADPAASGESNRASQTKRQAVSTLRCSLAPFALLGHFPPILHSSSPSMTTEVVLDGRLPIQSP